MSQADIDALAEFLKAADCQLDYELPVLNNTPANAADEVSYVQEKVGSNLLAVGFGNEPDAPRYNTNASEFAATWNAYAKAALARNNNLHFEGPDVGTATDLGPWVSAWYKEEIRPFRSSMQGSTTTCMDQPAVRVVQRRSC